jgi:hypothetical protein
MRDLTDALLPGKRTKMEESCSDFATAGLCHRNSRAKTSASELVRLDDDAEITIDITITTRNWTRLFNILLQRLSGKVRKLFIGYSDYQYG